MIQTGDFRELSKEIADDSIDLILTDPPYPKKFLPLWEDLGRVAARVLKPGGWLMSYGATEYLPHYLTVLGNHLDYFWVFTLLHNGGYPRMWNKKLMSGYKPVLVYTKGKPTINPWMATVHTDRRDKKHHKWGQGVGFPIKMIEMLTKPGGLVLDPMVGGGMTPVACKQTHRNFIGFEIDAVDAEKSRQRVATCQMPLPKIDVQQLALSV